jgi:hypothetical protein
MADDRKRAEGWARYKKGASQHAGLIAQAEGSAQQLGRVLKAGGEPREEAAQHAQRAALFYFAAGHAAAEAWNGAMILHESRPTFGKHPELDEAVSRGAYHYQGLHGLLFPLGLHFAALASYFGAVDDGAMSGEAMRLAKEWAPSRQHPGLI